MAKNSDDRLRELNDVYHRYHGAGDNIIYDARLTPETRVERFVEYALNNPEVGMNEEQAREFAISEMEKLAAEGTIAGRWGKVDPRRLQKEQEGSRKEGKRKSA